MRGYPSPVRDHIREASQRWVIRSDSEQGVGWIVVLVILVAAGLGIIVMTSMSPRLSQDSEAGAVFLAAGAFLLALAAVLGHISRGAKVTIDFAARVAEVGRRSISLDDVDHVRLSYWSAPARRSTSSNRSDLRRDTGWRAYLHAGDDAHQVLDSADELRAWRAAEALARRLGVAMVDDTGVERSVREANELDLPLAEAVARVASVPAPGEPPASLIVVTDPLWRVTHGGGSKVLALAFGAIGAAVFGGLAIAFTPLALLVLAAIVAGILYAGVFGERSLTLTNDAVVVRGPFPRGEHTVPLQTLEAARPGPHALHLTSDHRIAYFRVLGHSATWVRAALLHELRRRADASAPYR